MNYPRIFYLGVPLLLLVAALAAFLLSGALTSKAIQAPTLAIDMVTADNTYVDTANTMTVGFNPNTDFCLATATANPATHLHTAHVLVQNVEDLVGWQVRLNYSGDQFRPNTVNFTPFTDNNTGQNISFVNLPIVGSVHRDIVNASSIPPAASGPQTANFGSVYVGTQDFAVSPDTPAKATPDDTSYSAPGGGVLASFTLQVVGDQSGQLLFMDTSAGPELGSGVAIFDGTQSQAVELPETSLGDASHGEGTACQPATATPTPSLGTPTATPTITPPTNDNFGDRVVITTVPFTDGPFSNSGATVETAEPLPCAGLGKTIWYEFTPSSNLFLTGDTFGSDFPAAVNVYDNDPFLPSAPVIQCFQGFGLNLTGGTTYYFQVGGFSGASGNVVFQLGGGGSPSPTPTPPPTPSPTPIRISPTLTVNRTGTVSPDGFHVGLSGTLSCTAGNGAFLNVNAFQFARGQVLLSASGFASFNCNGSLQNWAITAESFTGFFKPGHANVRAHLSTFGPGGFDQKDVALQVRLRRGEPPPASPPESPPQSPPIVGKIGQTAGVVGGTAFLGMLAAGMTIGFVRVVRRSERRDRDL